MSGVEGYNDVLKALLTQERDSAQTVVDVEAAKLVAQKLGENGITGKRLKKIKRCELKCHKLSTLVGLTRMLYQFFYQIFQRLLFTTTG